MVLYRPTFSLMFSILHLFLYVGVNCIRYMEKGEKVLIFIVSETCESYIKFFKRALIFFIIIIEKTYLINHISSSFVRSWVSLSTWK